jgi:hypothetical protein
MASHRDPIGAGPDRGTALVIVLLATALLSAVGAALTVLGNTETAIASSFRTESELSYAAEAGVERALQDVRAATRWDDLLTGARVSGFLDSTLLPILPTGGTLDLRALTSQLQAATNANGGGPNTPQWRLFASGPLKDIAGPAALDSSAYLVVWVADDVSEADGNPAADTNGVLVIRGEAVGSGGRTRALDLTVARAGAPPGQAGLRVMSWREVR